MSHFVTTSPSILDMGKRFYELQNIISELHNDEQAFIAFYFSWEDATIPISKLK